MARVYIGVYRYDRIVRVARRAAYVMIPLQHGGSPSTDHGGARHDVRHRITVNGAKYTDRSCLH